MDLSQYNAKRDFTRTGEPKGNRPRAARRREGRFVIQKHAARRLHYDFRLEIDRVLKSWAVPKGIPTEKGDKRLAMQVEDHPVEYGSFEGSIPPGNYGAGTVMLWDAGTFEVLEDDPSAALDKGKLVIHLAGGKLRGQWTLVRMRRTEEDSENAWLLIKTGETIAPISIRVDDRSIISGRTMKRIAAAKDEVWNSNRAPHEGSRSRPTRDKADSRRAGGARRSTRAASRRALWKSRKRKPRKN